MPFLLLLFLTLVCFPESWPGPFWDASAAQSAGISWLGMGLGVVAAALLAARVRCLVARDDARRDIVLRRYQSWRFLHLIGLFLTYGVALYFLGYGWAVQEFCMPEGVAPGPLAFSRELLLLAPFLAALVLSWACFYDAERALHAPGGEAGSFWGRWAYVGFHVRHNLALVLIPLSLLLAEKALHRLFPDVDKEWEQALTLTGAVFGLGVFVCMPWILRLVLGLRPLPDCPLRDRLKATARRLNFRCSNILMWNTRGGVANAMVAGVLPIPRYVLLTDRLVADLTPDEVEAVFGHEIGHVKHRHMALYLGFLLLSLAVLWGGMSLLLPTALKPDYLAALPLVGVLGAYIFVVFGFLSRRCERQADIYGCRAVSCGRGDCLCHTDHVELAAAGRGLCPTGIRTFIDALEKVAFLNGISRDRPGWLQSWQHSTIARRVEFLQHLLKDPTLEMRFQRRVVWVKTGLLVGLAIGLAALLYVQG